MHSRTMILTALAGGPLIGVLLGLAIDPAMKPAPEPGWHKIDPDPIFTQPQRIVHSGPQDLSPTWYMDRMPTWKRRAAMREAAMYEDAIYAPAGFEYPEPGLETLDNHPTVTVVRGSTVAEVTSRPGSTPLDDAAEESQAAPRQAIAAIAEMQPSAGAAGQDDTSDGGPAPTAAIHLPWQSGT
jgi:hypothetical protein